MAYLDVEPKFRYNFRFERSPGPQNGGFFEKFRNILDRFILTSDMERSSEIMPEKVFLMLMTSLMTSQRDVKVSLLYSCLNEIVTFSEIQVAVFSQSSLNLVHICSLGPCISL